LTYFIEFALGANILIMKSRGRINNSGLRESVAVSINGNPSFPIEYDEITAFDPSRTPPLSYVFNQDCTIVVARDLDVIA
jgi:hypothetical protein